MRRKSLLDMYHNLKEAHSTTDFPLLLGNSMYKVLLEKFRGVNSPWASYVEISPLNDFKANDRIVLGEAPDLVEVDEEGNYKGSTIDENRYQIQMKTYGRTFSIGRRTIINDDLNALRRQPARFGRSSARTLAKAISGKLESDQLAYDGSRLFRHGTNWSNTTLANTATGIAAVASAMTSIETATEPNSGEKMGLSAKYLLVPPALEDTAMRIVSGQSIVPVSTSGGTPATGKAQRLQVLVEPFFSGTTNWYVMADPMEAPAIEVGFLNGKQTPDLLIKRADTVNLAGGEDPYDYEFDDIHYKVRHDWAIAIGMYQGAYRGN